MNETVHCPDTISTTEWVILWQEVLVRSMELISHHQPEEFGQGQKETAILLASILAEPCVRHQEGPWVRAIGKRKPGNQSHLHKTQDDEPQGRAVLLGSLTWLFSARAPFPSKESCFVRMCVSTDNAIQSVTQSPFSGLGRGPPSCKRPFRIKMHWWAFFQWTRLFS